MRIHHFEKLWLGIAGVMLVLFLGIVFAGSIFGRSNPSHGEVINPARLSEDARFANPRLQQTGPNKYDLYVRALAFGFQPGVIEIPQGAEVTIYGTSSDVVHGFSIAGTNAHMMLLPGQVNKLKHTFNQVGDFLLLCDEYCGTGHQNMRARVVVK